ncbi:uncharacterized protein EI97DRAFT_371273 [Westerdykella ornata]|uniref:Rhodopsin domain-containing protein n=1 Tax=Westerdykella ornata TaxID=318751 RepID=A0A6A6JRH1_WESOR|nr:uncharacterized protein EI97DRAFT_371273 [Westerdykella ornata]KAF2279162.1 hypothetical protein EI97DRAFT_371273 [Westerdykella ornata]
MTSGLISKPALIATNIACLAITTVFVVGRVVTAFTRRSKNLQLTDLFVYLAFILYLAMWVCYLLLITPTFKIYAVFYRERRPYPTMTDDAALMQRLILPAQVAFYTLLSCVKGSFLSLYHNLLQGLPGIYRRIWHGIVLFVILSWLGSLLSTLTICSSMRAQLSEGRCGQTPGEQKRTVFSLYFAFAVDVATDIAVMVLPIRLTWNLQMDRGQKIGIMVLFGSSFICIVFATLRVVQIGSRPNRIRGGTPELTWLILWTVLETSVAVIVGCCPGFAIFIRGLITSKKVSGSPYNGYARRRGSGEIFNMHSRVNASRPKPEHHPRLPNALSNRLWDDAHSSQEELARDTGDRRIVATTNICINNT